MSNTINPNLPPTASTQPGEQVTPTADADPEQLEAMKAALEKQMKATEQLNQQDPEAVLKNQADRQNYYLNKRLGNP